MEQKDQRLSQDPQTGGLRHDRQTGEHERNAQPDRDRLQPQNAPLKNNDRDVDPSHPRESSLGHR